MTTEEKIQMTRKGLESRPGYSYNVAKLVAICTNNEYIPNGAKVMNRGDETVYFIDNNFVTKNGKGEVIKSFSLTSMSHEQQLQLFAIWASYNMSK